MNEQITEDRIAEIVQAVLDRVFPSTADGVVDPRHFASVVVTMDDGSQMQGVVYAMEKVE